MLNLRMDAVFGRRPGTHPGAAALAVAVLLIVQGLITGADPLQGQVLMTQEEALALAFPAPARIERRTAYLTPAQLERATDLAGPEVEVDQGIVTYYVGYRGHEPLGIAYFDTHRVRTMAEVVMVVVGPDARVERIDVLKFMEPPEYRAPDGWVDQLEGRALDDALSLKGEIRNLTGATLTARSLTRAARRVLALHQVISPLEGTP